jgi:hypothetical protein
MTILAIDPGAGGGFAWRDRDGIVCALKMPDGMTAQCDMLRAISAVHPKIQATVELVGTYMPGNSGPAAATFARHCGHLDAALYCLGIPSSRVAPAKWMRETGTWPKDKHERKLAIREAMQRAHPHLRVTLATADALAMLGWAERQAGKAGG